MDTILAHPWLVGVGLLVASAVAVAARLAASAWGQARRVSRFRASAQAAAEAERERSALDELERRSAELLRRHRREGEIAKPAPPAAVARLLSTPPPGRKESIP